MHLRPQTLLLVSALLAAGCATHPKWARYEMCFGRSADAGRATITDQQWQKFRDDEIAGRFPDGFTVYQGNGYWRGKSETYTEPSEILMVVAPDTEATRQSLDAIALAYAQQFHQEAVLQIKSPAQVDFHNFSEKPQTGVGGNGVGSTPR